jgi:hypothetical protein
MTNDRHTALPTALRFREFSGAETVHVFYDISLDGPITPDAP